MEGTYYLQIGTILHERYEIKDILGAGGFGITYKAWDNTLQTEVCIKEYYPVGIANRAVAATLVSVYTNADEVSYRRGMQRFLREARGLAKLGSVKNIVNVHDYFEENNTAYMVMEYLKGKTLKCFVKENGGKVNEDIAIHIACSVLEALQHVHAVGIIHRDISPDNIYICDNMEVKLIDFGALKQEIAEVNKSTSIILKYGFAPPEQYTSNSRGQGAWTDIYAVGATVYFNRLNSTGFSYENDGRCIGSIGRDYTFNIKELQRCNHESDELKHTGTIRVSRGFFECVVR